MTPEEHYELEAKRMAKTQAAKDAAYKAHEKALFALQESTRSVLATIDADDEKAQAEILDKLKKSKDDKPKKYLSAQTKAEKQ